MATTTVPSGEVHVNEIVSPQYRKILYADGVWMPGKTFTNKYEETNTGVIFLNQLDAAARVTPILPNSNFVDETVTTNQKQLTLNNQFSWSRPVKRVTTATQQSGEDLRGKVMTDILLSAKEDHELSFTAAVVNEGTVSADTALITSTNVKDKFLDEKTALKKKKVKVNFAIVSPEVESALWKNVTNGGFFPVSNEKILANGFIGMYYGTPIFAYNDFDNATATYIKFDGATEVVDLTKTEFIMGDFDDIAHGMSFEFARFMTDISFAGEAAQLMALHGYLVPDPDRVTIKKFV